VRARTARGAGRAQHSRLRQQPKLMSEAKLTAGQQSANAGRRASERLNCERDPIDVTKERKAIRRIARVSDVTAPLIVPPDLIRDPPLSFVLSEVEGRTRPNPIGSGADCLVTSRDSLA
jgi:hypothetical protein